MNHERYTRVLISRDSCEFKFVSEGPKGHIQKIVQFIKTDNPFIYNLAFGDLLADNKIDDHIKNDNKDRNKILATVAATIYEFTARYPENFVFFAGSTPERTRLYRMALSNNLEQINTDFAIFGINLTTGIFSAEPFVKGKTYSGFLIKRKTV